MSNILDEYLIRLGATVDTAGLRRFQNALHGASDLVDTTFGGMVKTVLKAQTEIVGGFLAIGGAALTMVDKVAMADQEYRLFSMHMLMSLRQGRELKMITEELGVDMGDIMWDPELRERANRMTAVMHNMESGLGDFEEQAKKVRDIRAEFHNLNIELKFLGMYLLRDFMKALGVGPDDVLKRLRDGIDWISKHMPEISSAITSNFMPVWREMLQLFSATGDAVMQFGVLFTNVVGLLTGDTAIVGTKFKLENLAKAFADGVGVMAGFAEMIARIESGLAHLMVALTMLAKGDFSAAGAAAKAGFDVMHTRDIMTMAGGAIGAFGGPLGVIAGAGAGNMFGGALEGAGRSGSLDAIVKAIIAQESGGNPLAFNPMSGAMGLMQLMPGTARQLGVADPFNADQNRAGGTRYIQQLMEKYGNLPTALAAYNWGPGHVDSLLAGKATKLPAETSDYVSSIMSRLGQTSDVHIGSVTIHIKDTNASTQQIQHAVAAGMSDAVQSKTQRNLAEFNALGYSY